MRQKERNLKNISIRNSTMLAKEALQIGKSVYDLVLDQKFVSKEEIEKILVTYGRWHQRPRGT
jgi:aspartate ammonia-lyase